MEIMVRHARDLFMAFQTAQGMERAGADVFSVTYCDRNLEFPYSIWAKIKSNKMIDKVDLAIEKEINKELEV